MDHIYRFRWEDCLKLIGVMSALFAAKAAMGAVGDDRTSDFNTPIASFEAPQSETTEKDGKIALKVTFSHKFSGQLTYSVDGTAEREVDFDFDPPELTVATDGSVREINIFINIRDDGVVEDIETIRVTLQSSEKFKLGATREHVVSIRDNDANWRVVHDVDGMQFGYGMQIIRDGDETSATMLSDGKNGLPAGAYPVGINRADRTGFEAVVGPVKMAADQTLLGTEIARTFSLTATSETNAHEIDYERLLIGTAIETWYSADEDATYPMRGNQRISGTFTMSRTFASQESHKLVLSEAETTLRYPQGSSECNVSNANISFREWKFARNSFRELELEGSLYGLGVGVYPGTKLQIANENRHEPHAYGLDVGVYPGTIKYGASSLARANALLYWDDAAPDEMNNSAAFRYRKLFDGQLEGSIKDHWTCLEKMRAHQAASLVIRALRYEPWNQKVRRTLLDIYYGIATADKALALEKQVAVAELRIKPNPIEPTNENRSTSNEPIINKEIAALEEVLLLYRNAFTGYMKGIQTAFDFDAADYIQQLIRDHHRDSLTDHHQLSRIVDSSQGIPLVGYSFGDYFGGFDYNNARRYGMIGGSGIGWLVRQALAMQITSDDINHASDIKALVLDVYFEHVRNDNRAFRGNCVGSGAIDPHQSCYELELNELGMIFSQVLGTLYASNPKLSRIARIYVIQPPIANALAEQIEISEFIEPHVGEALAKLGACGSDPACTPRTYFPTRSKLVRGILAELVGARPFSLSDCFFDSEVCFDAPDYSKYDSEVIALLVSHACSSDNLCELPADFPALARDVRDALGVIVRDAASERVIKPLVSAELAELVSAEVAELVSAGDDFGGFSPMAAAMAAALHSFHRDGNSAELAILRPPSVPVRYLQNDDLAESVREALYGVPRWFNDGVNLSGPLVSRSSREMTNTVTSLVGDALTDLVSEALVGGPELEIRKDAALLFELIRDYLRTTEELSKLYIARGEHSDLEIADSLLSSALQSTYLGGHALLAMFPENWKSRGIETDNLNIAVTGWILSYNALGRVRDILSGKANILGYPSDFIVLARPDEKIGDGFDRINQLASRSLRTAVAQYNDAKARRETYGIHRDQHDEASNRINEYYDERLLEITGVGPDAHNYNLSNESLISLQQTNVEIARRALTNSNLEISNARERYHHKVKTLGKTKKLFLVKHDRRVELTAALLALGKEDEPDFTPLPRDFTDSHDLIRTGDAALRQKFIQLEGLVAADIIVLEGELRIADLEQQVNDLLKNLTIAEANGEVAKIRLEYEERKLKDLLREKEYLLREKEYLELRKKEQTAALGERYYAELSHRLSLDIALLRAEDAFVDAKHWLYMAMRAAEYEWNQVFEFQRKGSSLIYNRNTLFQARNVIELLDFSNALEDWNDFLDLSFNPDPVDGNYGEGLAKLNMASLIGQELDEYIKDEANYLAPDNPENPMYDSHNPTSGFKVLEFRFDTFFTQHDHFLPNRFLEKITRIKVQLFGGKVPHQKDTLYGHLSYGGVSIFRGESGLSFYPVQRWKYDSAKGQWILAGPFVSSIPIHVNNPPNRSDEKVTTKKFRGLSVAATDWRLYVPVEHNGKQLIDVDGLTEIWLEIESNGLFL